MITQQINLYLPEYRPKKDWLKLEFSMAAIVVVIAVLILNLFYSSHRLINLKAEVDELEVKKQALEAQVSKLKQKPSGAVLEQLEQKVLGLRAAIKNRKAVADVINGRTLGNRNGFSRNLTAMSEELVPGISLNSFQFTQGGKYVGITGVAQKPELIPLYISQLQSNDAFSISRFGQLAIFESDGQSGFTLSGEQDVSLTADELSRRLGALK